MNSTQINLQISGGVVVPSQNDVKVIQGDTVTFVNADAAPVSVFFSPDAMKAMSPTPAATETISADGTAGFAFTTSAHGSYTAFFGTVGSTAPKVFPTDKSDYLNLEVIDSGVSFGGFNNKGSTGA